MKVFSDHCATFFGFVVKTPRKCQPLSLKAGKTQITRELHLPSESYCLGWRKGSLVVFDLK